MTARILVVDDILANVKLLQAKLSAHYYNVLTATNGPDALEIAAREQPDLILLDIMMPGMDGFEVCERLKADPVVRDIPVVMVTALDQPRDRLQGLAAGADDFLTKPPNDLALFARVRSLVRVKLMIDELRLRNETFRELGVEAEPITQLEGPIGRLVIVEPRESRAKAIRATLQRHFDAECEIAQTHEAAMAAASIEAGPAPEVFVIAAQMGQQSGLTLCSELRARPDTRDSAQIVVTEMDDYATVATTLDLGANDYLMRPVDENELVARVRAQLLRRRYTAQLRAEVDAGIRMAVTDPLTGLYNRRYADQHMRRTLQQSAVGRAPAAALLFDLDKFKSVNDQYGHAAGDEVLIEFARRIQPLLRNVDLTARYGGEEFLAFLPETDDAEAVDAAERLRRAVEATPFALSDGRKIPVTVSIGVATGRKTPAQDASSAVFDLLARADEALYASKDEGRNRTTLAPPRPEPETSCVA
ncbi:MAG: PleD family two-component system response regulator [Neomegalonema sp.]|nr:PleD family two-component system response regulator [Neomegalonema sp.]